jgi:hypothetical protein
VTERERVLTALYDLIDPLSPDRADIAEGYLAECAATQIVRYRAEVDQLRRDKDGAYDERNRLVAVLSKLWPSHLAQHPESDHAWERDWMTLVCIHSPVGQLTWHIHDDHVGYFAHMVQGPNHWDGHTTALKYARLASLGSSMAPDAVDPHVSDLGTPSTRA